MTTAATTDPKIVPARDSRHLGARCFRLGRLVTAITSGDEVA